MESDRDNIYPDPTPFTASSIGADEVIRRMEKVEGIERDTREKAAQ